MFPIEYLNSCDKLRIQDDLTTNSQTIFTFLLHLLKLMNGENFELTDGLTDVNL